MKMIGLGNTEEELQVMEQLPYSTLVKMKSHPVSNQIIIFVQIYMYVDTKKKWLGLNIGNNTYTSICIHKTKTLKM